MQQLVKGAAVLLLLIMILPTTAALLRGMFRDLVRAPEATMGCILVDLLAVGFFTLFVVGSLARLVRHFQNRDPAARRERIQQERRVLTAVRRPAEETSPDEKPEAPTPDDPELPLEEEE